MAQKPDGKAATTERVTFTRPAAERIAKVVRDVEGGDRDCVPLTFGARAVPSGNPKTFRIGTYTGAWPIGTDKTITFKNQTNTPNTASVTNLFFPLTNTATATLRDCAIAKDGTAWFLIDVPLVTATAVFVGATQTMCAVMETASRAILTNTATCIFVTSTAQQTINTGSRSVNFTFLTDIDISAALNTANCTITVSKTPITDTLTFSIPDGTSTATIVQGFTSGFCALTHSTAAFVTQTATAVFAKQTFTASFVTFSFS